MNAGDDEAHDLAQLGLPPRVARVVWIVTTALFALLHLCTNGLHISDRELWLDEASTYGVAARSLARNLTLPIEFHSQPPLYYVLLHILLHFNRSEWFIRGLSWLLMLTLLLLVLWWLRELTPLARAFFAFTLLTIDFTRYLSQELRPYALAALTTFVASVLFFRALRHPSRAAAFRWAVAAILMLYSLAFDVWVFACHGLFLVGAALARSRQGRWRAALSELQPLIVAAAAASLLYLPYLAATVHWNAGIGNPSWRGAVAQMMQLSYYQDATNTYFPQWLPSYAVYGLFLLAIVGDLSLRRVDALLWLLMAVGQIAFVRGFLFGRTPVFDRYYTPAYPAFLFLMSLGVSRTFRTVPRFFVMVPIVLLLPLWKVGGPFIASTRAPQAAGHWRSVHRAIAALPGRKVIFFDVGYDGQMLQYVAHDDPSLVFALMPGVQWASGGDNHLTPSYVAETIDKEAAAGARCFYYVVADANGPYRSTFVPAMHERGFAPASSPGDGIQAFCKPTAPR